MNKGVITAHEFCYSNRQSLEKSDRCGCFYCLSIYDPAIIDEWAGDSAICPNCSINAVIGDASGLPINKDFLREMRNYWF